METLRAVLIGLGIGAGLGGPSTFFYRHQLVDSWREVFGAVPEGTVSSAPPMPSAAMTRFRRSWPLVVLQSVVVFASACVVITGDPLAVVLSTLVCLLTSFSIGMNILARNEIKNRAAEAAE
jgi:hypothetical protein